MIIGEKREQVIDNIRRAAENGTFHSKVEVDDPVLTEEQRRLLIEEFLKKKTTLRFRINNLIARQIINAATERVNQTTKIVGLENACGIDKGAIITSNHFNPLDNTVVRAFAMKKGKKKLCIASQETNLAMHGWLGYLMNYADIVPVSTSFDYMSNRFEPLLKALLDENDYVLIYPEQEMWYNYRKPRPLKRGAYYYAAKFGVPIISCFIEIRALEELATPEFHKVKYIMHILPPIFPDLSKNIRDNSIAMCRKDYQQKKAAYEAAYGKPLNYLFEPDDIAGWIPPAYFKDGHAPLVDRTSGETQLDSLA
jgi:1-acyl-sn-glycerol-3-phosphate acyltransferase